MKYVLISLLQASLLHISSTVESVVDLPTTVTLLQLGHPLSANQSNLWTKLVHTQYMSAFMLENISSICALLIQVMSTW